jgi:hypothetical protein
LEIVWEFANPADTGTARQIFFGNSSQAVLTAQFTINMAMSRTCVSCMCMQQIATTITARKPRKKQETNEEHQ